MASVKNPNGEQEYSSIETHQFEFMAVASKNINLIVLPQQVACHQVEPGTLYHSVFGHL